MVDHKRWVAGTLAAGLVLAAPGAAWASPAAPAPDRAELRDAVGDLRALGVTGAQAEVRDGRRRVVVGGGVADRRTGRPMMDDGHFRIGSDTKTFVAVTVLQLVGEGRLSLDDEVDRLLPDVLAGHGNEGRGVTVRQLLQHTSGIFNYTEDLPELRSAEAFRAGRYKHYDLEQLVAIATRHEPLFAPGTHWSYSNTNYILAGLIVEKVTGRPWDEEVRARILRPLGLHDTSFPGDRPGIPRPSARAYQQFAPDGPLLDVTDLNSTVAGPAGGLVSTTDDIARFWQALQRGQLLGPREMAAMHRTVLAETVQDVRPGLRYGLGVFQVPNDCGGYWGHPGDVPGTSMVQGVTPDGHKVTVLYRTTGLADPGKSAAMDARSFALLDTTLCTP
ncbi:serine hydrolase domain-containing protein [Actinoplanes sp. NPDC049265]|uniref:serine hydrolase domain-containing protein n=1 Tax=Actinoplanes sp. NPDC049265 TaxID=3363902 RepID=UPI003717138C